MFSVFQNLVLGFWKLLGYAFQTEILEKLACLMLPLNVDTAPPQQMSSVMILIHSMDARSRLMID